MIRAALLLCAFCLAGPALAADQVLRLALHGDIRGFNPGVTRDGDTDTVHHHIFESLVAYDADLNVQPMLAESVTVSEDLTRYEFRLRPDLIFHNGEKVTADHVVWSWRRMLDPQTGWRCRAWYDGSANQGAKIESVTIDGDGGIVFELARPSAVFLDRMANVQCLTAILHPESVLPDGSFGHPIGTGPYELAEWRRGEYIELRRFDGYSPRPEPPSGYAGARIALAPVLRFMVVPDPAIAQAGLLSGDIDILPNVPLHLVSELERVPDVHTEAADLLYWEVLLMQTRHPLLEDLRIRQAIAHAINIEQVTAIASFDHARANPSAVPYISRFHTEAHDQGIAYDPERARALLRAAGYDGQVLRLQTNRKYSFMFDTAVAVQAMLVAVGMDVRLEVVDWATQLGNYFSGDFELGSFGYSGRTHPVLNYATILGSKDRSASYQWESEAALELSAAADQLVDGGAQKQIFEEIHALMIEEVPIVGLFNRFEVDAVRAGVVGYRPWSTGRPRLWGVERQAERRP
ncbi:MAG: ABC transporter substrate-binding protein [Sphingomonadales bacterium]|nr:ABC transporter substrate-binding protein [Sphingomonadales bacterium]